MRYLCDHIHIYIYNLFLQIIFIDEFREKRQIIDSHAFLGLEEIVPDRSVNSARI